MRQYITQKFILPKEVEAIFSDNKKYIIPSSREELFKLAMGDKSDIFEVGYDVPNKGYVVEATVANCKNGLAVNYPEKYMRKREPNCMLISDNLSTDKEQYKERMGEEFNDTRAKTLDWLKNQDLIVMPFLAGDPEHGGYPSLLISPANTGFFAAALLDLQGFISKDELDKNYETFKPYSIIYVAPTFRHTNFNGKQVVVHNRLENLHEVFSYNLYPGPSAKKGVYGVLLNIGEQEGWVTLHSSAVKVILPRKNVLTIMHEGASGSGKSEMSEQIHTDVNGKTIFGTNTVSGEKLKIKLNAGSKIRPVTDDMTFCHPKFQKNDGKLYITDAESGWFIRIDHINHYGVDPNLEKMCTHPKEPIVFFNLEGTPHTTCLIWEHTMDEPGKPCSNPRVIIPREFIPHIVNKPVGIDIRSFGVRTPPCTKDNPTYGIMGLFHVLPPALAWLWRLTAPRGYSNPSIIDTAGMSSEGVGSYWPFATGKMVKQANLLLEQFEKNYAVKYILCPNQHIGAWKVGFMPQWLAREYLAENGKKTLDKSSLVNSKCSLLGYTPDKIVIGEQEISEEFIRTNLQAEVGNDAYDAGSAILQDFFKKELAKYLKDGLDPLGRKIIECCLDGGSIGDYESLIKY